MIPERIIFVSRGITAVYLKKGKFTDVWAQQITSLYARDDVKLCKQILRILVPQFYVFIILISYNFRPVDTQAAQNYKLPEDGQELKSKHVAAIINQ